jgi:hypothetical protein
MHFAAKPLSDSHDLKNAWAPPRRGRATPSSSARRNRNAGRLAALVPSETTMKTYLAFLVMVGIFALSILFLADRERKAGIERLSNYNTLRHSAIEAGPDLCQQPGCNTYMRNERY